MRWVGLMGAGRESCGGGGATDDEGALRKTRRRCGRRGSASEDEAALPKTTAPREGGEGERGASIRHRALRPKAC